MNHFTEHEWYQIGNAPPNEMMNIYALTCYSMDQRTRDFCELSLFDKNTKDPLRAEKLRSKMVYDPIGRIYLTLYKSPILVQEKFYNKFEPYFNNYGLFDPDYLLMSIGPGYKKHDAEKYKKIVDISDNMMKELHTLKVLNRNEPLPMWEVIALHSSPNSLRKLGYTIVHDQNGDTPTLRPIRTTRYRIAKHLKNPDNGRTLQSYFKKKKKNQRTNNTFTIPQ